MLDNEFAVRTDEVERDAIVELDAVEGTKLDRRTAPKDLRQEGRGRLWIKGTNNRVVQIDGLSVPRSSKSAMFREDLRNPMTSSLYYAQSSAYPLVVRRLPRWRSLRHLTNKAIGTPSCDLDTRRPAHVMYGEMLDVVER